MSILINNGNHYSLNSSETCNSLKSSKSSSSSLSSLSSSSSSSSCHKRSKAVDLNRNNSNSQNSSISTAPTTATAGTTTPRKPSIIIPSKLANSSIPLVNGNINYAHYYDTKQQNGNHNQQLKEGEPPLSAPTANNATKTTTATNNNSIQESFETIPCFNSTTNTTITTSRSNPTNSSPISNDNTFPKQMIHWNQFLQEEKDLNDNMSTIDDDDKTFYMEQLNLNVGHTPNNHRVPDTDNDLLPGTSKSLIAKYHYQLNYNDEVENIGGKEYDYSGESRKRKGSTSSNDRRPRRGGRTSQVFRNTLNKFTFKPKIK
ncbi:conserved hypothetical protein [Candida dubliniensis CD36]|uniref:Uncharacterized protein n=1 Tax=Candida dubliniensis (strain CD36 / ATCC MYA-646 / CBS 7987 / NCPF 3949 / NRRL Y-17841) TaxID=573826 RepID=B9WJZ5_CANDC|nr:conserved hypothetical protein [Candida dubliniensis CD36]CAX40870.1 conserved hypothetical protein [Candida dubliniensis CD36]